MKKITLLLSLLLFTITLSSIKAQTVNIPDANFKNALLNHTPVIDTNSDGEIQVSEAEALSDNISVSGQNIADLTGIEAFINITSLNCSGNQLTSLNLSSNTALSIIRCENNQLTFLDVSQNNQLISLHCFLNQLTSLDLSQNLQLQELACRTNLFTTLDLSQNVNLTLLFARDNSFTFLDLSKNSNLADLDLRMCSDLEGLNIANGNNQNLTLNVPDSPNIDCIQVDQGIVGNIPASWQYNNGVTFSENCMFLGLDEVYTKSISVHPNPTNGILNISSNEKINFVQVANMLGQVVASFKGENNLQRIDLSNLSTGIYIAKISDGIRVETKKIIKR